jgi:hypothetical protein
MIVDEMRQNLMNRVNFSFTDVDRIILSALLAIISNSIAATRAGNNDNNEINESHT